MENSVKNNINFCGKFSLDKSELSKISLLQKAKFLKQKEQIIDEFCKTKTSFFSDGSRFIVDIKDEKEDLFLSFAKKLGLVFKKLLDAA